MKGYMCSWLHIFRRITEKFQWELKFSSGSASKSSETRYGKRGFAFTEGGCVVADAMPLVTQFG